MHFTKKDVPLSSHSGLSCQLAHCCLALSRSLAEVCAFLSRIRGHTGQPDLGFWEHRECHPSSERCYSWNGGSVGVGLALLRKGLSGDPRSTKLRKLLCLPCGHCISWLNGAPLLDLWCLDHSKLFSLSHEDSVVVGELRLVASEQRAEQMSYPMHTL